MTKRFLPYGRQSIDQDDIQAVLEVLQSDWLTQGPKVQEFEQAVADYCGVRFAVAVANGTAALHLAALAAGFGPGDEVITSPITFAASANCILYAGAKPIFADIDPVTYCLDIDEVRKKISSRTKGLIPVHFAGQPCDMAALYQIAGNRGLTVIEDAAHALGASYQVDGRTCKVGSCAHSDMTIFSFHPVKHITTGEGGIITTNSEELYQKLLLLRTHGITKDPARLSRDEGPWYYEMQQLGFNYRLSDIHGALGVSQFRKLDAFVQKRREIAASYQEAFGQEEELILPSERAAVRSSFHLYVLQFKTLDRSKAFARLWEKGLGVNVHYIPVHLQPYYVDRLGFKRGDFPKAEVYYDCAVTIPLFPAMSDDDVQYVIEVVLETVRELKG